MTFVRRACLWLTLCAVPVPLAAEERVVALDWGLVSTLTAMDVALPALPERGDYARWVGPPPEGAADLGLRMAPDLERLAQARPTVIAVTQQFAPIVPRLDTIAPTVSLVTYSTDRTPLVHARAVTRTLGAMTGHMRQAEALIADTDAAIAAIDPAGMTCPVLVLSILDARMIRVFGAGSLYDDVLKGAGLENAWQGPTNVWGFTQIPASALLRLRHAAPVVIAPVPATFRDGFSGGVMAQVPAFRTGTVRTLPPIWPFGGLPEARAFARGLSLPQLPECPE